MSTTRYTYRRMARKKRAVPVSSGKQASSPFFDFGGEQSFFSGKVPEGAINEDCKACGEEGKVQSTENFAADRTEKNNAVFDKGGYDAETIGRDGNLAPELNHDVKPNIAASKEESISNKDEIAAEAAASSNLGKDRKEQSSLSDT